MTTDGSDLHSQGVNGKESGLNRWRLGEERWGPVLEGSGSVKKINSHQEKNQRSLFVGSLLLPHKKRSTNWSLLIVMAELHPSLFRVVISTN